MSKIAWTAAAVAPIVVIGCNAITGVGDYSFPTDLGAGGASSSRASSASSTRASSSSGHASSTHSSSATGGGGGAGAGGGGGVGGGASDLPPCAMIDGFDVGWTPTIVPPTTVTEANGKLTVTLKDVGTDGGTVASEGVVETAPAPFQECQFTVDIKAAVKTTTVDTLTYFGMQMINPNNTTADKNSMLFAVGGGLTDLSATSLGVQTLTPVTVDEDSPGYLRFRFMTAKTYLDHSATGSGWTQIGSSVTPPFATGDVYLVVGALTFGGDTDLPGTATFEHAM